MKNKIYSLCIAALCAAQLQAQSGDMARTNDLRFRWNMGQFANVGRYAFQFGLEKDIADNKTLSAELGLSFFKGSNNVIYQRYNYSGIQGLIEYRNYFRGFSHSKIKPFMALGLSIRQLAFDADVNLGYNITSTRDWNTASHFESTTARYNTFTARLQGAFGLRLPISPMMYFEGSCGPAFGYYNVSNNINRSTPYVIDNFNNPFFMSSQAGSYYSPAIYGSVSFGFVLSKKDKS